ncbi:hypothetical protein V6N12_074515 [Hibiscus sabdariffa]|uniref:Uncharacterized protein n=1 Tax=Hibiscus sabdariffa TaxID=183260 RepID=A0ABR2ALY2_9ROSI
MFGQVDAKHSVSPGKPAVSNVVGTHQAAYCQPLTMAHIQGREADIRVISELSRSLDKKEALLKELRNTNNDISEIQNGDGCLKGSEHFKKHITTVLVQLKEANEQVSSALLNLRQRNTYPANPLLPWQKPPTNLDFFGGLTSSLDSSLITPEVGSVVGDIVNGSRLKAHAMVDAAIKAMSSMKEGEDAFMRIGEALNSVDKKQFTSDISMPIIKSPQQNQVDGSVSITSKPMSTADWAPNPGLHVASDKNEEQVPSELITSCVATLLMIQRCTERQFPPAEVAQIIDSAITSLHPCCPQNLPVYREIQMYKVEICSSRSNEECVMGAIATLSFKIVRATSSKELRK